MPLERWRRRSPGGIVRYRELARLLAVASAETVRRYCLPYADPEHRHPRPKTVKRIFMLTGGEVEPNDLFPVDDWRAELAAREGEAA